MTEAPNWDKIFAHANVRVDAPNNVLDVIFFGPASQEAAAAIIETMEVVGLIERNEIKGQDYSLSIYPKDGVSFETFAQAFIEQEEAISAAIKGARQKDINDKARHFLNKETQALEEVLQRKVSFPNDTDIRIKLKPEDNADMGIKIIKNILSAALPIEIVNKTRPEFTTPPLTDNQKIILNHYKDVLGLSQADNIQVSAEKGKEQPTLIIRSTSNARNVILPFLTAAIKENPGNIQRALAWDTRKALQAAVQKAELVRNVRTKATNSLPSTPSEPDLLTPQQRIGLEAKFGGREVGAGDTITVRFPELNWQQGNTIAQQLNEVFNAKELIDHSAPNPDRVEFNPETKYLVITIGFRINKQGNEVAMSIGTIVNTILESDFQLAAKEQDNDPEKPSTTVTDPSAPHKKGRERT